MNPEDTVDLVQRALAGDQAALERLVARLTPVIQARVARTLRDYRSLLAGGRDLRQEVEDLTQEVFLELFRRDAHVLRSWQAERGLSLENFVGLMAERRVISFLRSGKRNPRKEDPSFAADELEAVAVTVDDDPEKVTASREQLALLLDRLREEVSPQGWQIFDLLYIQELSQPEAKAATGLSDDAIYAWRSRLRRLAQKILAEMSENPVPPRKS